MNENKDMKLDIEGAEAQADAAKKPDAEAVKSVVEDALKEVDADAPAGTQNVKADEPAEAEPEKKEAPADAQAVKAEKPAEAEPEKEDAPAEEAPKEADPVPAEPAEKPAEEQPAVKAEEPAVKAPEKHDSFDDDGLNIPKVGQTHTEEPEPEPEKLEEPEIPRPLPVSEEPKKKSSKLLVLLCVLAAAACAGIGYIAHQNSTNRAMNESVSTMANEMKLELAQDIPSIDTKKGLTYNTKTGNAVMDQIPDQLKPYIISAPSEGTLEIKNLNSLLMSGDHTITFVISNTDKYGQSVTNSYDMLVHVKAGQMDPATTATADASADPSASPDASADPSASADATATPEPTPGEVGDIVVINPTPTPTTTPSPTPNTYLAPDGSGETISEIYDAPAPYNETDGGASTGSSDSNGGSYQNVGPADWSN